MSFAPAADLVLRPHGRPAMYSSLERLHQLATKLPPDQKALFKEHFVEGKREEQLCAELGITSEQFQQQLRTLLRNVRGALGANLAAAAGPEQS
ncbi:sigma factor-like helix-turn-helix DNA-binding protein [Ramlibacter sp. AN1133]|uniref:sigma factor-like helix-turn-helix DNA-binding protein n=1 Tax=Ramlibacter sp. AN1133 TaxID=3133429 RepID=UPI0030BF6A26